MSARRTHDGEIVTFTSTERAGSIRTVGKALALLEAFAPHEGPLPASELIRRTGFSRASFYRLVDSLLAADYLQATGSPPRFSLGGAIHRLANVASSGSERLSAVRGVAQRLWERTGETVAVFERDANQRVCVLELESPQPLSFRRGLGHRAPLLVGASGRAILATSSTPAEIERLMRRATAVDALRYRKDFRQIRAKGYATSRNEIIQGAVAIATPLPLHVLGKGGSLCVFGPTVRLSAADVSRIGKLLTTVVEAL